MTDIQKELFVMKDQEYKKFHSGLIPTVNPDNIIGIRTPDLRKFALKFSKTPEAKAFISQLPHRYYEENNLHAFIIEKIPDYERVLQETTRFLPYIDNWATCDMFFPKVFKKNAGILLPTIKAWMKSNHVYTVRYAIGLLMKLFLEELFTPSILKLPASVHSDEYYINMMIAWFFATALAKQYDSAVVYIEEKKLDTWVHNKAIQKAIESRRIDSETKAYLRQLKI